jgi:hypothetical protein
MPCGFRSKRRHDRREEPDRAKLERIVTPASKETAVSQRSLNTEQTDVISRLADEYPERPAPPRERWFCVETRVGAEGFVAGGITRVPAGTPAGFRIDARVEVEILFAAGVEVVSIPLAALFPPDAEVEPAQDEPSFFGAAVRAWAAGIPAPAAAREEVENHIEWLRCFGRMAEEHAAEHGCDTARKDGVRMAAEADALLTAGSAFGYAAA